MTTPTMETWPFWVVAPRPILDDEIEYEKTREPDLDPLRAGLFDESQHPREESGRFAYDGGPERGGKGEKDGGGEKARAPGTITKKGIVVGDGNTVKVGDKVSVDIEVGLSMARFNQTTFGKAVAIDKVGGVGVEFKDGSRRYFAPEDVGTSKPAKDAPDEGEVRSFILGDQELEGDDVENMFDSFAEFGQQVPDPGAASREAIRGAAWRAYTAENFDESLVVREHGKFARKEGGSEADVGGGPSTPSPLDEIEAPKGDEESIARDQRFVAGFTEHGGVPLPTGPVWQSRYTVPIEDVHAERTAGGTTIWYGTVKSGEPVIVYRTMAEGEMAEAAARGYTGWRSNGTFVVRSIEGDTTQFSANFGETLPYWNARVNPATEQPWGYTADKYASDVIVAADIQGLPFQTIRDPEGTVAGSSTEMVGGHTVHRLDGDLNLRADVGLGVGVSGSVPFDRVVGVYLPKTGETPDPVQYVEGLRSRRDLVTVQGSVRRAFTAENFDESLVVRDRGRFAVKEELEATLDAVPTQTAVVLADGRTIPYLDADGLPLAVQPVEPHTYERGGEIDRLAKSDDPADMDRVSQMWDENRAVKRAWEEGIADALATGKISREDAEARWGEKYGSPLIDGIAKDLGGQRWAPLPDELWHVTTDAAAVERAGMLMTRNELDMDRAVGLGGGSSDTISFTTDRVMAERIYDAMGEAQRVASGAVGIQNLIDAAASGDRADGPFITNFMGTYGQYDSRYNGYTTEAAPWRPGDPYPNEIARMLESSTPDERLDVYKAFSMWRQVAGGPEDPLFFGTNAEGLAAKDPSNFGIVKVRPVEGAQGVQMSSMAEWRLPTGAGVTIDKIAETASLVWRGSRFARRAYVFDESAVTRDAHGRFSTHAGDDEPERPVIEHLRQVVREAEEPSAPSGADIIAAQHGTPADRQATMTNYRDMILDGTLEMEISTPDGPHLLTDFMPTSVGVFPEATAVLSEMQTGPDGTGLRDSNGDPVLASGFRSYENVWIPIDNFGPNGTLDPQSIADSVTDYVAANAPVAGERVVLNDAQQEAFDQMHTGGALTYELQAELERRGLDVELPRNGYGEVTQTADMGPHGEPSLVWSIMATEHPGTAVEETYHLNVPISDRMFYGTEDNMGFDGPQFGQVAADEFEVAASGGPQFDEYGARAGEELGLEDPDVYRPGVVDREMGAAEQILQGALPEDFQGSLHTTGNSAEFSIEDQAGNTGTLTFDVIGDRLHVDLMEFDEGMRDKGLGTAMVGALISGAEQMGMRSIEFLANITVGGYAWARMGAYPNEQSWETLKSSIGNRISYASQNGIVIDDATTRTINEILAGPPTGLPDLAALDTKISMRQVDPRQDPDGRYYTERLTGSRVYLDENKSIEAGKALLLGTSWAATIPIGDQAAREEFAAYEAEKAQEKQAVAAAAEPAHGIGTYVRPDGTLDDESFWAEVLADPALARTAASRFARRAYTKENFDESFVTRERGRFAEQHGGGPVDSEDVHASEYGLDYQEKYVNDPDLLAARKWNGWDAVPVTQVDPKSLIAIERLSPKNIDKVVTGKEPLREDYVAHVVRKNDGTEIIVDGHHRAAMAAELDRPLDVKVVDAKTIRADFTRRAYTAENFDESLVRRDRGRFARKDNGGSSEAEPDGKAAAAGTELAAIAAATDWGPARREGDNEWDRWGYTPTSARIAHDDAKYAAQNTLVEQGFDREAIDLTIGLWSGGAPDIVREQIGAPEPDNERMVPVWRGANEIHEIASATEIGTDVHRAVLLSDEQAAQLAPGVAFNGSTLESWSRDIEVAKDFGIPNVGIKPLDGNVGTTQVLMRLGDGHGMDVAMLGYDSYAWQDEVIVPGDVYRIDSVRSVPAVGESSSATRQGEAPYPRVYLDVTAVPHPASMAAADPADLGRALVGSSLAEMSIALGHPPDEAVVASASRFARRAYTFDETAHPRGEGGRFTTKEIEDLVTESINMDQPEPEGRGPTQMIQMNAAIAEDVMRRNDIDTVMGKPLSEDEATLLVDDLMEKYVPGLDYQMRMGDELVDQYAGPETAAFTSRGMTETLPPDHEMYNKDVVLLFFRDGARPVEVMHEMAHVTEGSWRAPPDDGHSNQWFRQYYEMVGAEGYPEAQNVLKAVMWDPTLP